MPKDYLAQIYKIASDLSGRQRIVIAVLALVVLAGLAGFSKWSGERNFKPLYTSMAAEDAGAVVAKLKETAVEYRVTDGGSTVLVPSEKVAESRIQMASAGLPKSGRIGFELFDKTNFGISDFTEQVNYRRAVEGELERSIKAVAEITSARVHLTFPKDSVFIESRLPAKASVLLGLKPQSKLTPQNVSAITHLVASAVEGLAPEAVSVMDERGNLLVRPRKSQDGSEPSDEVIEYRQKIERDLLTKINLTLEPLVGAERFRAGVSVECDFTSGEQSEETFDPEKSVMTNSQKTEETASGTTAAGGVPGTASNLPRPAARSANGGSSSSRRSETIAYQTSKLVRRLRLPQGSVKRVSASVLLDQAVRWEGNPPRRILVPPAAENLRAIRELVAGAIGLTPTRGDALVIETLPFESTLQTPPPQLQAPPQGQSTPLTALNWKDPKWLIGGGATVLILAAAVALFFRRKRKKKATMKQMLAAGAVLHGKPIAGQANSPMLNGDRNRALDEPDDAIPVSKIEALLGKVKLSVAEDPALAASVLRTWLEDKR